MKKILLIIFVLVSVQSFGQIWKLYAERLNSDQTLDSFFTKFPKLDSIFNAGGNFVSLTVEVTNQLNLENPSAFANYHKGADGIYRNFVPMSEAVHWIGIESKPLTFPATATTVGASLLGINNPASPSLIRVNANGTTVTRTATEAKQDLSLENVDNTSDANKPVSTAQQTALNLKQDLATNTGGWMVFTVTGSNATTTGQTLVDITGLVSGTLLNATKYEVEAILDVGTSAVTTGCQYGIQTGGTGGAGVVSSLIIGTTTTNAAAMATLSAPAAAQGTFLTTSGGSGTITMRGWVTTRGTGTATISIQFLKVTSGTATVRTGSKMRIRLAL